MVVVPVASHCRSAGAAIARATGAGVEVEGTIASPQIEPGSHSVGSSPQPETKMAVRKRNAVIRKISIFSCSPWVALFKTKPVRTGLIRE